MTSVCMLRRVVLQLTQPVAPFARTSRLKGDGTQNRVKYFLHLIALFPAQHRCHRGDRRCSAVGLSETDDEDAARQQARSWTECAGNMGATRPAKICWISPPTKGAALQRLSSVTAEPSM